MVKRLNWYISTAIKLSGFVLGLMVIIAGPGLILSALIITQFIEIR
jgi:hypothetical protein